MQELSCPNMSAYLDLLDNSAELRRECERRMTVSISRFFRDRQLWQGLEKDVLPYMVERHQKLLHVWSAGCACGEEVYSFKIVCERLNKKYAQLPEIKMVATDVHPDYIEKARAGIYTKSSVKEVSREVREYCFDIREGGHRFAVKAFLKTGIDWKVRDIFNGPPGVEFDIIFLRNNLLTYYQEHFKLEAFDRVVKTLAPDGWLIVGSHEKIPAAVSRMQRHHFLPWAYRQDI